MGKSNFVWGSPSLSDDIYKNLSKTHHKEKVYENSFAYDWGQSMINSNYERPFEEVLVRNNNENFVSEYGENHAYFDEDKNYKKSIERDYGNSSSSENDDDLDYGFEMGEDGFYIIPENPDYPMPYQNNLSYEDTTEFENYFDRNSIDLYNVPAFDDDEECAF